MTIVLCHSKTRDHVLFFELEQFRSGEVLLCLQALGALHGNQHE